MIIREAHADDISAIIELLKSSLGETSSPKTEAYWHWKHIDNPFGKSPVKVCVENGMLTGVRAFMRWQWQNGHEVFNSLRAVDTATHPDFQGKGIFKKLTLGLADECAASGYQFIFNTPNDQSRPGYLKMGWVDAGRLPVTISLFPQAVLPAGSFSPPQPDWNCPDLASLCLDHNADHQKASRWFTPKSPEYLKWRYGMNPVINYTCMIDRDFFVAAYVKNRGRFKELRISEWIVRQDSAVSSRASERMIRNLARQCKTTVISFSPEAAKAFNGLIKVTRYIGPILTLKKLAISDEGWQFLHQLPHGAYQIGDLELF